MVICLNTYISEFKAPIESCFHRFIEMLRCNWYCATVGGSWEKGHYNTSSCMSNLLVLKHLLGVVLLQTFEQWGLEMCFKQQFVVWEFSFRCDAGFKFSGKKRVIVIIEAAVSFWAAAEPSLTSNVLMHLICRIQTPGELDVLMPWRSEGARCSSFPLSLPVSHFCRMFLLSWVPYCSHTELAGLPGLLLTAIGPLIGSSCALAFLAPLGLELQWARQHKAFWEEFCRHDCERNQMKKYPDDLREQLWNDFIITA